MRDILQINLRNFILLHCLLSHLFLSLFLNSIFSSLFATTTATLDPLPFAIARLSFSLLPVAVATSRILVSVRNRRVLPQWRKNRVNRDSARLRHGSTSPPLPPPLFSLLFIFWRTQLEGCNYNTISPSFSVRFHVLVIFPFSFSLFRLDFSRRQRDFDFTKLAALRKNRTRCKQRERRRVEWKDKGGRRRITRTECLFNRFPFQSIR